MIERLMCDLAVDLAEIAGQRGQAPAGFSAELAALAPLQEDELVS